MFVESYGKVAVQGSSFSPGVDAVLDAGTQQLQAAGFSSRSGWLTSPTFGGISWLAHSTLQSGTWVDSQRRYDQLVASDRLTLSQAFKRGGWRTVDDVPSNDRTWPQGSSFYHYDKVYDRRDVGYRGPTYAYASMPDQYVLAALQRLELAKRAPPPALRRGRPGVEPHAVDPHPAADQLERRRRRLDLQPASGRTNPRLERRQRSGYGRSIEYTLRTLFSFVEHYGRQEPRDGRARRPSAGHGRHRIRRQLTTCRSRSSPTTRRCCAGSPGGAGSTGCGPARRRRSGR